jgi:anti-sigma-K factor RskA
MSDHPTRDLLPGYALGCLEAAEERLVREHLEECDACRRELAALNEVTGSLALAVPPAAPSAGLEERIAKRISLMKRISARARVGERARAAALFPGPWSTVRSALPLRFRAVGAVAAILIVALAAGNVLQLRGRISPRGPSGAASLSTATLTGTAGLSDAYGTVVLDPTDNRGVLAVRGLPRLDADHRYQFWLVKGDQWRSAGLFSVSDDGYGTLMLDVPPDFKGFTSFCISAEPTGGSSWPTGKQLMRGSL